MDAISAPATEETSDISINTETCYSLMTNIKNERPLIHVLKTSDFKDKIQNDILVDVDNVIDNKSSNKSEEISNSDTSSLLEKVSNDIDFCTYKQQNEDRILVDIKKVLQNGLENVANDSNCIHNDKQSNSFEDLGSTANCSIECTYGMEFLNKNIVSEYSSVPEDISDNNNLKTPCFTFTSVDEISLKNCNCNSPENNIKKKLLDRPQNEVMVHFASPLTVLHEYVELSECTTQSTLDLMDYENSEELLVKSNNVQLNSFETLSQNKQNFTEGTESSKNINVRDKSLVLLNCNSNLGKLIQDHENICMTSKLASKKENALNTSLEAKLKKENGVIREFDFSVNESKVICTKIGLSDSVSVGDIGMESDKVIHNEVRDILNELVDKCCQVSLDTKIWHHNDLSLEKESSKKNIDNGEKEWLDSQVIISKTQEYKVDDDLNIFSEKSNVKQADLSCCEGNHEKGLMDDFNTASCSIDHLILEPEIALCADSALMDSQISVITNSYHSSLEEGETQSNRNVDDKINEVNENESTVKQHEKLSIYKSSCNKSTDLICSCITKANCIHGFDSHIKFAKSESTHRHGAKFADKKLQEGTSLFSYPASEQLNSIVSVLNNLDETCSGSHGNENNTYSQSTSVKTEQEVKEISHCEKGLVEIQSCNSTSLDLLSFSTSNHENIELGSKHLNGSLKRDIHMANSNLREKKLNLTDKETTAKCIKPDVLEEHQILSANSKIGTKNTDMKQDIHDNEQDELKERNCKTVTFERSLTSVQNGPLQSNLKSETISIIKQIDNEEIVDNYGFVPASEFHSSQLSDNETTVVMVGNDLQFQDMLDTPVISEEDYQSPCKLQKYDIIDCHLSGEFSTRSMDQAVPEEENSTEIIDTDIGEHDTFYEENHMQQKASEDNGIKKQCFKWKYTPSMELESNVPLQDIDEDKSFAIPPLQTCHKPVRVGLSRKQKVKSLHPKFVCRK